MWRANVPTDRGDSEIIGLVLLFGLVILGAALIVLFGTSAVSQVEDRTALAGAEDSLQDVRGDLRTLSAESGPDRVDVELPGPDTDVAVRTDGRLSVTVNGDPVCTATRDLGTIEYRGEDETLAYQASAVWRTDGDATTTVAPPDLDYRSRTVDGVVVRTLDFPLTNVNATESDVAAATELTAVESGDSAAMRHDLCLAGPDADRVDWVDNVTLRVENTTFYRGWADHLRDELVVDGERVGTVRVYDDNRTVVARGVPLGAVNDDDSDGYPDPDVDPSDPSLPDSLSDYRANYAPDPAIDNCPPEKGADTYNPRQRDADGDPWGDACDGFDGAPDSPGNDAPDVRFDGVTNTTSGGVVTAGYTVNATDTDGLVTGVTVALVAVDGGTETVLASTDHPVAPNRSVFRGSGTLSNATGADSYWLVAVARDDDGATADTERLVHDAAPTDTDGDGVPDAADDCPGTAAAGANGCAVVDADADDALRVNASSATVSLLGSGVAETVEESASTRPPVEVVFALDGTGSMDFNDEDERRVDAAQAFVDELNPAVDRAGWVQFRIEESAYPDCSTSNPAPTDCAAVRTGLTDDFPALESDIEGGVVADGGTYIAAGINESLAHLQSEGSDDSRQAIVLLTDGINDAVCDDEYDFYDGYEVCDTGELNDRTRAAAQAAAARNVTVHVVNLEDGQDSLLGDVASATGGEYEFIDDADELEATFEEIAGEVTEGEDVDRVELKRVGGTVRVGGPGSDTVLGGDLNDPGTSPSTTVSLGSGTDTSRVSLSTTAYECTSWSNAGTLTAPDGTTYNESVCTSNANALLTVDNGTTGHAIYRDGDPVPDDGDEWFRDELANEVPNTYLTGRPGNERFDLADDQAVFVLRSGENYTAVLFDASAPSPPGSPPPSPPSTTPSPPTGGSGGAPGGEPRNGFVVDVDGTEVVVDTDG